MACDWIGALLESQLSVSLHLTVVGSTLLESQLSMSLHLTVFGSTTLVISELVGGAKKTGRQSWPQLYEKKLEIETNEHFYKLSILNSILCVEIAYIVEAWTKNYNWHTNSFPRLDWLLLKARRSGRKILLVSGKRPGEESFQQAA